MPEDVNSQSSGARGFVYVAAAIVVAAALVSSSLIVAPLEATRTSTSTITSTTTSTSVTTAVTTTTLPQVTVTNTIIFPPVTVTSTSYSTLTVTSTVTVTTTLQLSPCTPFVAPPRIVGAASSHAVAKEATARPSDPMPATIGTSSEGSATNSSSERKILIAAGLIWVFYTDGCNVVYQTSPDGGINWSSPPRVAREGIARGWFFTVAQNGTTVYLVVSASDGSTGGKITLRDGTMNSDGTITWATAEQDLPYNGNVATVPTVAVDTAGNVWIAIEDFAGGPNGGRSIHAFKGSGGTWSDMFDLNGLADFPRPILLALASGKMALEILTESPGQREAAVYTTANGGATWSQRVATPPGILTLSSVSVGDTVYSVTAGVYGNVSLWTFAYGGSSFVGPAALAKCCTEGYDDATITTDGGSFLFVDYSNSSSVLYETSHDLGKSWTPATAISVGETNIQPGTLASNYLTSGLVCIAWTAQNSAVAPAFLVRFAPVSVQLP